MKSEDEIRQLRRWLESGEDKDEPENPPGVIWHINVAMDILDWVLR